MSNISYQKIIQALRIINPVKKVDGKNTIQKSPLSSLKGKVGTQVYNVKHDLLSSCKALDNRHNDLIEEISEIRNNASPILSELHELNNKENPTKKDKKRIEEINELIEEANNKIAPISKEIEDLLNEEVEINYTKGKLKLSDIEDVIDADDREIINFLIEEE